MRYFARADFVGHNRSPLLCEREVPIRGLNRWRLHVLRSARYEALASFFLMHAHFCCTVSSDGASFLLSLLQTSDKFVPV